MSETQPGKSPKLISIAILLAISLGFSTAFALQNPVFESPDEPGHLAYVNFVSQNRRLPNQLADGESVVQGHHHPLYYTLAAGCVSLLELDRKVDVWSKSHPPPRGQVPRWESSWSRWPDNEAGDFWLYRLLRLSNALVSSSVSLLVYRAALFLLPERSAFLGSVCVAGLPQLQFIGASISNDALTATLSALSLLLLIRVLKNPETRAVWLLAGVAIGFAILAKKSNLVLLPGAIVAYLSLNEPKRYLAGLCWMAAAAAAICGWWFVRNYMLYDEFLGSRMEEFANSHLVDRKLPLDPYFRWRFPTATLMSFFGSFGWLSVYISIWALGLPIIIYATGTLSALISRPNGDVAKAVRVAATICSFTLAGLYIYNLTYTQPQGRLLFPMLPALGLLIAIGFDRIMQRFIRVGPHLTWSIPVTFVLCDAFALWRNITYY